MLLFLSITGIILSFILVYFNARKFRSSLFLGGFFFLISIYGLIQHALLYSKSVVFISIMYTNVAFSAYLIGPMIYWYVRSVLNDHSRLSKKDLWHLMPALIFFVTSLPYMFTPWAFKMQHANEIMNNLGYLGSYKPTILYEIIPNAWIHISRPLIILAYATWSAWIFIRYIKLNKEVSVFSGQRYIIKWLMVTLGFLLILTLSQLFVLGEAFADRNSILFFTYNLLQIASAAGLIGLLIAPFFFPGILYGMPRFPGIIHEEEPNVSAVFLSSESEKRKMPVFESEYLQVIEEKIGSTMNEHKPYLQPDCNLTYISKCIQMPVHHLAYYFREVKKQTFNDFRNELRVNHAKQLIREGKAKELTLEGIGLQSGFSTRNTFFTAFKKMEGETPGMYSSKY